jgi:hypothetical protein
MVRKIIFRRAQRYGLQRFSKRMMLGKSIAHSINSEPVSIKQKGIGNFNFSGGPSLPNFRGARGVR